MLTSNTVRIPAEAVELHVRALMATAIYCMGRADGIDALDAARASGIIYDAIWQNIHGDEEPPTTSGTESSDATE